MYKHQSHLKVQIPTGYTRNPIIYQPTAITPLLLLLAPIRPRSTVVLVAHLCSPVSPPQARSQWRARRLSSRKTRSPELTLYSACHFLGECCSKDSQLFFFLRDISSFTFLLSSSQWRTSTALDLLELCAVTRLFYAIFF